MKLTPNFDSNELRCKCGCGQCKINDRFVERLQLLRYKVGKPVIVTSGYRCPTHSVRVGGSYNDAHTHGIAADIYVNGLSSIELARIAEDLHFGGIGIIDNKCVHVDIRDENGCGFTYPNSHWFGDERTHNDWISSFKSYKG